MNCFQKTLVFFAKANEFLLDTFFPIHCISCKEEGFWLCEKCLSRIKFSNEQVCGVCEKAITPDGRTCLPCKKLPHRQPGKSLPDGLIVASSYAEALISESVHLFKYRFIHDLHRPLGDLLVKILQKTDLPLPDLIIPVPLHKRRLRWRGFNQSSLLANHLASNLLPGTTLNINENSLVRNRYTSPQMKVKDYANRQRNIADAFSVRDKKEVSDKIILLVDDITTTGSTIFECAKVLKNAGAREVFAIVIARQETKKIVGEPLARKALRQHN